MAAPFLIGAGMLLVAGALFGLAAPFIALRSGSTHRVQVRRLAYCSGCVVLLVLAMACDLSFVSHAANVLAVMLGLAGAGALALFSFRLAPRKLGVIVGGSCVIGWLLAALFAMLTALLAGHSAASVVLKDGLVCRDSLYGIVPSGGQETALFERTWFIERRIYQWMQPDGALNDVDAIPAAFRTSIAACRTAIDLQRSLRYR